MLPAEPSKAKGGGAEQDSPSAVTVAALATKKLQVLRAVGSGKVSALLGDLDQDRLRKFREMLRRKGIDLDRWGVDGTKSVEYLFWEVNRQKGAILACSDGPGRLTRVVQLVKVRLVASVFGVDHELHLHAQFLYDGHCIDRTQLPLRKLLWVSYHGEGSKEFDPRFTNRQCPFTEDWRRGCKQVLKIRFGLSDRWQKKHLEEQVHAYSYKIEEEDSKGYPGLLTIYCVHQVTFRVLSPDDAGVECIGLPEGREFASVEGDFSFARQQTAEGLPIGTRLNIWTWQRAQQSGTSPATVTAVKKSVREEVTETTKRVPLPTLLGSQTAVAGMRRNSGRPPNEVLSNAARSWSIDWSKVTRMAERMGDADYTLVQFNEDLAVFPELRLYLLEDPSMFHASKAPPAVASSGRTVGDEYQRTVGAFFAVYWLLRLHIDGKVGFTFGVDEQWQPLKEAAWDDHRIFPADKRRKFYEQSNWDYMERLLLDADLLKKGPNGETKVNTRRVAALLALTAVHDIMKMEVLLPQVQEEHAPYHGYAAGDVIGDHDHALSYLMDYYPELLPSFSSLAPEERESVQFTQCQLCFNHGWFVQGEAPPGAIFTKFREVLRHNEGSKIEPRDIAFYFVHWLTDLAGAEPTPLAGCEKFVVKFPLAVLNSFLRSFEFVMEIADKSETEVMEDYLKTRWEEHTPSLGPIPTGESGVALMRLLCMAQGNAPRVLQAFSSLPKDEQRLLSAEMARTGCVGQSYSKNLVPKDICENGCKGPALLVYYGPALLQNLGGDSPITRLRLLAEVYRCGRLLWPLSTNPKQVASHVIVRIDAIKALSFDDMLHAMEGGDSWALVKHNESEAFIERQTEEAIDRLQKTQSSPFQILKFKELRREDRSEDDMESNP